MHFSWTQKRANSRSHENVLNEQNMLEKASSLKPEYARGQWKIVGDQMLIIWDNSNWIQTTSQKKYILVAAHESAFSLHSVFNPTLIRWDWVYLDLWPRIRLVFRPKTGKECYQIPDLDYFIANWVLSSVYLLVTLTISAHDFDTQPIWLDACPPRAAVRIS